MFDDLKAAWRSLRQSPGFALSAIVTLALAVGANAAILGIADAVLFRPLPYTDPDRVFVLQMLHRERGTRSTSIPDAALQLIDDHHSGLSRTGQIESIRGLIAPGDNGVESVQMAETTATYLRVLGVGPVRGRLFDDADPKGGQTAILSHRAWQQRFGGREEVIGQPVTLGGRTFDIVGVLPRGFLFPTSFVGSPEILTVMPLRPADPKGSAFHPVVRLEPGVTRAQAQAEIDRLVEPLFAGGPLAKSTLVLDEVRSILFPVGQPIMRFLLAAAVLVLLVGCSNLANLMLARSRQREREIGVRAALGASALRIVRPVILEGLMLGVAGAALALAVAYGTFDALLRQVPPRAYAGTEVGVDLRIGLAALALGAIGGVMLTLLPAWRLRRVGVRALVQRVGETGTRWQPFGRPMVAVQVAVAVVLVFGTVVAGRALFSVWQIDLGFSPERVIRLDIMAPGDAIARQSFYLHALGTLLERPEVLAAGAASPLPLDGAAGQSAVLRPGTQTRVAEVVHVLPGFFEAAAIPVRRGRLLSAADVTGGDAAVVTETAARALFPERDALGESFAVGDRRVVVVGVVGDAAGSLTRPTPPRVYVMPRDATRFMTLLVRTRTTDAAVLAGIKRAASALTPTTPVNATWWEDDISGLTAYRNPRFQTIVLATFAALALGLTALGIVVVITFQLAARRKELGIRLALGSSPGSLMTLILKQTLVPVAAGLVLGLLATRGLARLAEAQLYAVQTHDPITLALAAIVVTVAAIVSAYVPARRAGRIDPVVTLRAEV